MDGIAGRTSNAGFMKKRSSAGEVVALNLSRSPSKEAGKYNNVSNYHINNNTRLQNSGKILFHSNMACSYFLN